MYLAGLIIDGKFRLDCGWWWLGGFLGGKKTHFFREYLLVVIVVLRRSWRKHPGVLTAVKLHLSIYKR